MGILLMLTADVGNTSMWTSGGGQVSVTQKRTGAKSFYNVGMGYDGYRTFPETAGPLYARVGMLPSTAGDCFFTFRESTTSHITILIDTTTGVLTARRGAANGTVLGTSAINANLSVWNCIEVRATIHDSTGIIQVKLNSVLVINLAVGNQDTRNGGTGLANNLLVLCTYGYVDDVIVRDDAWPGPGGIYVGLSNADGSDIGWAASAGNRYACVNEAPPDFTDYILTPSATPGVKGTFAFPALEGTFDLIPAVCVAVQARLDAAGTGAVRAIANSSGDYANGDDLALDVSPLWAYNFMTVDPHTSAAWLKTGVTALLVGVESR